MMMLTKRRLSAKKFTVLFTVLICLTLLLITQVGATNTAEPNFHLISDRQWNEKTKVWIARALVSEAGWDETTDHVAIAYVLYRRWQIAKRSNPKLSFISVIKMYCAGFGRTAPSPRQRWVINLVADGSRPKGWPNDIRWRDYRDRWLKVVDTVESWRTGRFQDPCNGLSRYWGGPMDRPSRRMVRMDCGPTKNWFYTVKKRLSE
jgi:hypothetical protein